MEAIDGVIIGTAVLVIIVLVGFWLWSEKQFRYKICVKDLLKGRKQIKIYRAKQWKDTEGVLWLRLAGEQNKDKKTLPLPPEEAIEIDNKGKKYCECYRTETGGIIWLAEKGDVGTFPEEEFTNPTKQEWKDELKEIQDIDDLQERKEKLGEWKRKIELEWRKENNIIAPFQPLTTVQRQLQVNNIRKAESRKGFSWKENIITLGSLGALVLVIFGLVIFWGDIAQPALQANKQAIAMQDAQLQTVQILKEIKTDVQTISSDQQNLENRLNNIERPPE